MRNVSHLTSTPPLTVPMDGNNLYYYNYKRFIRQR
jgi:hypothetical protein